MSAILPRPVDHEITDPIIEQFNSYLKTSMSKNMNLKLICPYRHFTNAGKVKSELFAKRDGGLHLNTEGMNRLKQFFFFFASYFTFIIHTIIKTFFTQIKYTRIVQKSSVVQR